MTQIFRSYNVESQYEIVVPKIPPPIIAISYYCIHNVSLYHILCNGAGREILTLDPLRERALWFYKIPGARPTRLGDPGINYSPYRFLDILL